MKHMMCVMGLACMALVGCERSPVDISSTPAGLPQVPLLPDTILTRRNFLVVFDGSGSMRERGCSGNFTKLEVAQKAVINFAGTLQPNDNLGLFVFDGRGESERMPLSTNSLQQFREAIEGVQATSGTPLYSSIRSSFAILQKQREKQLQYGEFHMVVVTDGVAGDRDNGIIDEINRTPIIIHTIGFCIDQGHSLNQPGKVYYTDAQSPEQLKQGLQAVLAESEKFAR